MLQRLILPLCEEEENEAPVLEPNWSALKPKPVAPPRHGAEWRTLYYLSKSQGAPADGALCAEAASVLH